MSFGSLKSHITPFKCLHAFFFKLSSSALSITVAPPFMLCFSFSLCGPLPEKTQSALIGQLSQAWASITLFVCPSALPLLGAVTVRLWHHNLLNVLTACLKDQCLNTDCVRLSVDAVFIIKDDKKTFLLYGQTTRQQRQDIKSAFCDIKSKVILRNIGT